MRVLGRVSGYNSSLQSINNMYDLLTAQLRHVLVLNPWAGVATTWVRYLKRTAVVHPDPIPPQLLPAAAETDIISNLQEQPKEKIE